VTTVVPGDSTTYNIMVTNNGPSTAVDATVINLFPAAITAANWTAVASAGSSVAVPSGFGNIFTPVTLLPGGFAIFTAVAQISPSATGSLTNTAEVFGLTDTNPGNNTATDTDVLGTPAIQIVKFVNGEDADMLTGPHVAAGSTVTSVQRRRHRRQAGPHHQLHRRHQQQRPARHDLDLHRHRHRPGRPADQRRHRHRPGTQHQHDGHRQQPGQLLRLAADKR
jgi:uncharacterized repeat protein (TIGR01451 family)